MPHKVTSFIRQSTTSLENQVFNLKKSAANATRRRDSPQRPALGRSSRSAERVFSYATSIDEDAEEMQRPSRPRMTDESRENSFGSDKDHKEHHHRLSFPHFGRSSKDHHNANAPAALDWKLESPPIVFYGNPDESSGALVSGQLFLNIKEGMDIDSFNATLNIHITQKRPFTQHCHDCTNQFTELKKWNFLQQPLFLAKGQHAFPFSILLEGHLPATMDGALVSIAYEFTAEAVSKSAGFSTKLQKGLDVKRSVPVPETPHHSVRVFPPTNIKANVHYPQVIHPIGTNKLELRMDGIAKHNATPNTVEYWKLKKLIWRLEETAKTVAPACEKHAPKSTGAEEDQSVKKGVLRTETRTIGERSMFSGWKSNYVSPNDSLVEFEFDYSLLKHTKFSCDTKSRDGTEVTHQLMVEMVVSQEWAPVNKPTFVTQTGVGRILRMHFSTTVTECGGIGISWDNEAPPIYQDVPPSPPGYGPGSRPPAYEFNEEAFEALDEPLPPAMETLHAANSPTPTRRGSMEGASAPPSASGSIRGSS